MQKELNDKLKARAREVGAELGKQAQLDFGAGAEWMHEQLTVKRANEKHTDTHQLHEPSHLCSHLTCLRKREEGRVFCSFHIDLFNLHGH